MRRLTGLSTNQAVRAGVLSAAAALALAACGQSGSVTPADAAATPPATTAPAAPAEAPIPLTAPFNKDSGFSYMVDTTVDPDVRKLKVFEDGKELGPADSIHDDIRKLGMGRYSHWKATDGSLKVYFSASDNSDPSTNGKTYELR